MMNLTLKKKETIYISSEVDLESYEPAKLKKSRIILIGDAVLGIYKSPNDLSDNHAALENDFIPQRPRSATGVVNTLIKKENPTLELFVGKEFIEKLKKIGVSEKSICVAADSVLRYIKFKTFKKHGVILCVSSVKNKFGGISCHLVEEYKFSNGELISFNERRYDVSIFGSEINKALNETIRTFSAEILPVVIVCGPDTQKTMSVVVDHECVNQDGSIFSRPVQSSFTYESQVKEAVIPYVATLGACIAVATLMTLNGKAQLDKAQADYQRSIAGFESIYEKGRAPIELVEKRTAFMAALEDKRKKSYRLPLLVNAIAKVRNASPDLNIVAEDITYYNDNTGDNQREEDYKVVLRFKKLPSLSPEAEFAQWQDVFLSFSKEMRGQARVNDTPITLKLNESEEVFVMTILGNFEVAA